MVYARFCVRTSKTAPGERSRRWTPPSISDWIILPLTASLRLAWGAKNRGWPQAVFIVAPLAYYRNLPPVAWPLRRGALWADFMRGGILLRASAAVNHPPSLGEKYYNLTRTAGTVHRKEIGRASRKERG